jgi:hypothetical protein
MLHRAMDTPITTSTPGAAAPTSTPSATPTPATPPASSAASPSATPVAAPGTEGATPAAVTPPAEDTRSIQEILAEKIAKGYSEDGVGGAPATEQDDDQAINVPAADGDVNEDGKEKEVAAVPVVDEEDPFKDFGVDEANEFGPTALSAKIAEDAATAAALEANPELKASIFANARKAERAAKYDEILGSPEEAKVVVAGHDAFSGISGLMADLNPEEPSTYFAVVNGMLQHATLKDEDGNPRKNADGTLMTDGTVGRFLKTSFKVALENMAAKATAEGDEEAQQAFDLIMERAGLRAPSSPNEDDVSEELKAREAKVREGETRLEQERRQQAEADTIASETRINTNVDTYLDKSLNSLLDKATGLDAFARTAAETRIRKELRAAIRSSNTYKTERNNILARPAGAKREKDMIALNTRYINTKLPAIAKVVFADAGASVTAKAAESAAAKAAREAAAQSESRGSLAPSKPAAPASDSIPVIEAELTAKLGHPPTTQQILAERMNRRNAATAAR